MIITLNSTVPDQSRADGVDHAVSLSDTWTYTPPDADLQCVLILCHGRDAVHDIFIDDVYLRARP